MTEHKDEIRARLSKMGADTQDPKWSSFAVDELFRVELKERRVSVSDVYSVAFSMLQGSTLTRALANFIKDLASTGFTKFKNSYGQSDLGWIGELLLESPTEPKAYFAMYTMPPEGVLAKHVIAMGMVLKSTDYWEEFEANFADEIEDPNIKKQLMTMRPD